MRRPVLLAGLSLLGVIAGIVSRTGGLPEPVPLSVPALPTLVSSTAACPLTPEEEQKAVEKFDEMWPVLRHPRCLNCHGAVNPFVEPARGHHGGGKIDRPEDARAALDKCEECHYVRNWDTPHSIFFFTGRSARQLCMQFKESERDPTMFVKHLYNDRGGTPFIETAFKGDRGLNDLGQDMVTDANPGRPFQPEKPPMTHGELVQIGSDWANLVGERGWKATPDCGCGRRKSAWTGTVTGVWNLEMDGRLHVVERTTANVRFELDTTFGLGPDLYWKSVSGELEWSTEITGECRASASGMLPIDRGADDNPLAILSLQTELGGGPRYMVSVGPWRDEYEPRFMVRCPTASFPGVLYGMGVFWHHPDAGIISPDGKTLQGRFEAAHPAGTNTWTWDLQLEQLPAEESR